MGTILALSMEEEGEERPESEAEDFTLSKHSICFKFSVKILCISSNSYLQLRMLFVNTK